MGVVVQQMVPADSAGVLFTYHPTTGDPRQMLITANFGLGEVWAYDLDEMTNTVKPLSIISQVTVEKIR
jgi:phosphoenolpyruvate synthase/pyruvate phosphate dikinase